MFIEQTMRLIFNTPTHPSRLHLRILERQRERNQQSLDACASLRSSLVGRGELRKQFDVLERGQVTEQHVVLRADAKYATHRRCLRCDVEAADDSAAARRRQHASQHRNCRRLASAVGAFWGKKKEVIVRSDLMKINKYINQFI